MTAQRSGNALVDLTDILWILADSFSWEIQGGLLYPEMEIIAVGRTLSRTSFKANLFQYDFSGMRKSIWRTAPMHVI
jgi:hypothetical protein